MNEKTILKYHFFSVLANFINNNFNSLPLTKVENPN